jgi:hypothetical protein
VPALDHALQSLEAVEIVAVHAAVADAQGFADAGAERHFHRRRAPGDRQTGAGHAGESKLARGVVHLARSNSTKDAIEDRHCLSASSKHAHDLLENS